MIAPSSLASDDPLEASAVPTRSPAPSPFFWSVRCELWHSRWIVLGPLAAAIMLLAGYLFSTLARPSRFGALLALDAVRRHNAIGAPYALAVAMVALGAFPIGMLYSLVALRGERRDRSILFWKSLPVSDETTVLSKAAVVFVVLPVVVFAVTMVVHAAMLMIASGALIVTGGNPVALWRELPLPGRLVVFLYGIGTLAVQYAPIYAWLLMVSAWATRLAALWAFLPPYGIVIAEKMMFGHSRFEDLLRDLVIGAFTRSFALDPSISTMPVIDRVAQLAPAALFGRPAVWIGLALATVFLSLAIRARRDREPV
jgi:ABC-2 type transport system permease protein